MRLARELVLALWAGVLVSIGALVAPTLFAILASRVVAGGLAAELFRRTTFLSLVLAILLVALGRGRAAAGGWLRRLWPLAPAALLAASEFGIRPLLEAARAASGPAGRVFAAWHALSAAVFVAATALVIALLIAELRRRD